MSNDLTTMALLIFVLSFLIGSIPTGLIVSRAKGIDIRKFGSGNIGATNVLRVIGKEAALITLSGDILKGILPVALMPFMLKSLGHSDVMLQFVGFGVDHTASSFSVLQGLAGLGAILGHNYSVFLNFRGGKGVATSLGVLLAYVPHAGLMTVTTWLLTARWSKISSLSALTAFALSPLFVYIIDPKAEKIGYAVVIAILIFLRHKDNIKRLIDGTEDRIGLLLKRK